MAERQNMTSDNTDKQQVGEDTLVVRKMTREAFLDSLMPVLEESLHGSDLRALDSLSLANLTLGMTEKFDFQTDAEQSDFEAAMMHVRSELENIEPGDAMSAKMHAMSMQYPNVTFKTESDVFIHMLFDELVAKRIITAEV